MIISGSKATLHELKTVYTLDDAYTLYDIIYTDNYNNNKVNENLEQLNKQKK